MEDKYIMFLGITDETIMIWESLLINSSEALTCYLIQDDTLILDNLNNDSDSKVIRNDCKRTRTKDKNLLISFQDYLELALSYYCKVNKISYKQGLNEILAPFMLLKSKFSISLSRIYNLFSCFMEKYLIFYYSENDFQSLQLSLNLLNILLKYHNPLLFHLLDCSLVTPEMYATSWILTCFASKCQLNVTFSILDFIIKENDELFMLYFLVAFLSLNIESFSVKDNSYLPAILSGLSISSIEECHKTYIYACKIREETPSSFQNYSKIKGLFSKRSTIRIDDRLSNMPIFPSELLFLINKDKYKCPNNNCINNKLMKQTQKKKQECNYCINKHTSSNIIRDFDTENINYSAYVKRIEEKKDNNLKRNKLIILDIRQETLNDNNNLINDLSPFVISFSKEELLDENFAENITDKLIKDKHKVRVVILTDETYHFSEYEEQFYIDNIKKEMQSYKFEYKESKIFNNNIFEMNQIRRKDSNSLMNKLQEYNNFRKLVRCFLKKNFSHISYVYGGYSALLEII